MKKININGYEFAVDYEATGKYYETHSLCDCDDTRACNEPGYASSCGGVSGAELSRVSGCRSGYGYGREK